MLERSLQQAAEDEKAAFKLPPTVSERIRDDYLAWRRGEQGKAEREKKEGERRAASDELRDRRGVPGDLIKRRRGGCTNGRTHEPRRTDKRTGDDEGRQRGG